MSGTARLLSDVELRVSVRTTRPEVGNRQGAKLGPEAVTLMPFGIVTILEKLSGPENFFRNQLRLAVNKVGVEIPAGLVDSGESAEQCVAQELEEEIDYVDRVLEGSVSGVSLIIVNDPGILSSYNCLALHCTRIRSRILTRTGAYNTNFTTVHVPVYVDQSAECISHPKLGGRQGKCVEYFSVPLTRLSAGCLQLAAQGLAIDARVAASQ